MKEKTVEAGYPNNRDFWFHAEIKLDKKNTVWFKNYLETGYHDDGKVRFMIGLRKTNFTYKETGNEYKDYVNKELSRRGSGISYNDVELGFMPPKTETGAWNEEIAFEYMYAMMDCYDVKARKFDMEKALEVNKKFREEAEQIERAQNRDVQNAKVPQKENVKVAEEVEER